MQDMTYEGVGVNYDAMDPFKRLCQLAGHATESNLVWPLSWKGVETSRGESAYLVQTPFGFLGFVIEGLGTKNVVADAMYSLTGKTYYDHVAQCNVAMNVNDLITLGVLPVAFSLYVAGGNSDWFCDQDRAMDLAAGTKRACDLSGCIWAGGETPTLKGIVNPDTVDLSGACFGFTERPFNPDIHEGDEIVLIGSSGIHANGLTLARKIADSIPDGYLTLLPDGRTYGDALLDPTVIYVSLVRRLIRWEIPVSYLVNITGHGWRKLMRARGNFRYVIDSIPDPQPVFDFMMEHGPVTLQEAYGNLNMGSGFAVYTRKGKGKTVVAAAEVCGMSALVAGHIEDGSETKRVVIDPLDIEYTEDTLQVR